MVGREGSTNDEMKEYREESKLPDGWLMKRMQMTDEIPGDRVQWFRAEAEMYRWREQYERKHTELLRVRTRFGRDAEVWSKCAAHLEQTTKSPGAVTYAREQAAMYKRFQHNSRITFKSTESAAHAEWVAATSFDDLVARIDSSRDANFKWMDDLVCDVGLKALWILTSSAGYTSSLQGLLITSHSVVCVFPVLSWT
jgi:hypothetical protein